MKKSISLLLAAIMVFALAAIACADATTLTAWISDGAETVIYTSMFDDFNSKHDDIQVDYQFFAQDELLNKLQTAPIVGDTPDLIVIDGLQIPYFQDLGMIACLDDYIDELNPYGYQPFTMEELLDELMKSSYLFDSVPYFFVWASKVLATKPASKKSAGKPHLLN